MVFSDNFTWPAFQDLARHISSRFLAKGFANAECLWFTIESLETTSLLKDLHLSFSIRGKGRMVFRWESRDLFHLSASSSTLTRLRETRSVVANGSEQGTSRWSWLFGGSLLQNQRPAIRLRCELA